MEPISIRQAFVTVVTDLCIMGAIGAQQEIVFISFDFGTAM